MCVQTARSFTLLVSLIFLSLSLSSPCLTFPVLSSHSLAILILVFSTKPNLPHLQMIGCGSLNLPELCLHQTWHVYKYRKVFTIKNRQEVLKQMKELAQSNYGNKYCAPIRSKWISVPFLGRINSGTRIEKLPGVRAHALRVVYAGRLCLM